MGLCVDMLGQTLNLYRVFSFIGFSVKREEPVDDGNFFSYRPLTANYRKPIVFKNVSLTLGYKPVLKKINFKVKAMQRVAICGFEGCGRSSIFDLLMSSKKRDPKDNSSITIFGLEISEIKAEQIKKELFLLERDSGLFEGTIRKNLDPYCQHSDEVLIELLTSLGIEKVLKRIGRMIQHELKKDELMALAEKNTQNFKMAIEEVRMNQPLSVISCKSKHYLKSNKIAPVPKMSTIGVQSASNLELRSRFSPTKKLGGKIAIKRNFKHQKEGILAKPIPDKSSYF